MKKDRESHPIFAVYHYYEIESHLMGVMDTFDYETNSLRKQREALFWQFGGTLTLSLQTVEIRNTAL